MINFNLYLGLKKQIKTETKYLKRLKGLHDDIEAAREADKQSKLEFSKANPNILKMTESDLDEPASEEQMKEIAKMYDDELTLCMYLYNLVISIRSGGFGNTWMIRSLNKSLDKIKPYMDWLQDMLEAILEGFTSN